MTDNDSPRIKTKLNKINKIDNENEEPLGFHLSVYLLKIVLIFLGEERINHFGWGLWEGFWFLC